MNNYECFKNELTLELMKVVPDLPFETVTRILSAVDVTAQKYNIELQTTDIISVEDSFPALLRMFIAAKAVEGKSRETLRMYTITLSNMFAVVNKPCDKITTNDLRVYMFKYQQERKIKNCTMETMRHTFNSFFSWCADEDYIPKDPAKRLGHFKSEPSERHAMDPIELEYIRDACKTLREKALVDFLYSTGCRVAELCACRIDNVDFVKRTVQIEHGKGDKARVTFLNPESVVSLKAYLASRKDESVYLFTHERRQYGDGKLSSKAVQEMINKIVSRIPEEIQTHITPHVFRHTAVTVAIKNGMPVEQAKEFAGHANLNTTLVYTRIKTDDVQRSHDRYLT